MAPSTRGFPGAVLGVGETGVRLPVERRSRGLFGDDAHRSAHRFRSVQRALRPTQHLNARDIDDVRVERLHHRYIVDVETRGVGALHAAECDAAGGE